MKTAVAQLIRVLSAIADALDRWRRRLEQKRHEEESHEIEQDTVGWFDDHFNDGSGRLRHDVPDDAGQTGTADTAKHSGE